MTVLAAQTVSLIGNVVFALAVPLYVLASTGSPALTGLMAVAATAPVVIGGSLGGVLVDRWGYRRSSIVTDLLGAGTTLAIPVVHATVGLPFWALFALVFAAGLFDVPGQSARTALLPEAAARAGVGLERASGWNAVADRGSRLIGAPLAGGLILLMSPLTVVTVTGVCFLVSALLVARGLPSDLQEPVAGDEPATGSYRHDLADGFRWLWRDRLLRAVVRLVVITNAFDVAKYSVLLPVYATDVLAGPATMGVLVGAHAGGALVSSLVFGTWGHRMPRRLTFTAGFLLAGGPAYLVLAAEPGLGWCVVTLVLAGLAAGGINPVLSTVMLERVPAGMRARVGGVMTAGCWAGMPIGALLAGVAVEHAGLTVTLVVVGVGYLLVTLLPLRREPWQELDRPAVSAPASSTPAVGPAASC